MLREHGRELLEPAGEEPLHRRSHLVVQRSAVAEKDRLVGGLLGEAVMERVLPFARPPDESRALQGVQPRAELGPIAGDRAQDRLIEGTADHGCELQRAPGVAFERVEARGDQCLQGRRDGVGRSVRADRRGQLLEEERVPLGPLEDPRADGVGSRDIREELVDQRAAVLIRERRERDLRRPIRVLRFEPPLQPPGRGSLVGPEREQHERRLVVVDLRGLDQEVHRRVVAPMEVLEDQHARLLAGVPRRPRDQIHDRAAEGLAFERFLSGLRYAEERAPHAHVRLEPLRGSGLHGRGELLAHDLGRVGIGDASDPRDRPAVLRVRTRRVVGDALPDLPDAPDVGVVEGRGAAARGPIAAGLFDQSALAQARLADQRDHPATPTDRLVDRPAQDRHLVIAAHEGGRPRHVHAGRRPCATEDVVSDDGVLLAPDLDVPGRTEVERTAHEPRGVCRDLDAAAR